MEALIHTDYEAYFRYLVSQHPALVVPSGKEVFGLIDIEEVFGQFRNKIKQEGYFFRLIRYIYRAGQGRTAHGIQKLAQGGWMIGKMLSARSADADQKNAALSELELINDQFIERIVSDSQAGNPLWKASLDQEQDFASQFRLAAGDGTFVAISTTFSFEHFLSFCPQDIEMRWLDSGITPIDLL